jgi:hypothetical protein
MTIKAVLRDGRIQPLEPLPPQWAEGQELIIEQPEPIAGDSQITEWAREFDEASAQISPRGARAVSEGTR